MRLRDVNDIDESALLGEQPAESVDVDGVSPEMSGWKKSGDVADAQGIGRRQCARLKTVGDQTTSR